MILAFFKRNLLFLIIVLIGVVGYSYYQWLKTLPQDYTVGQVIQVYKPRKGGISAEYSYFVDNEEEQESLTLGKYRNVIKKGMRFLVEYPEDHVSEGRMLFDHPVPDGIEAPEGGWDEKPEFKKE